MDGTGENTEIAGGTGGLPGFPLRLSRSAEKRTIGWAIAGFDPSSGAGVTADLMTFAAHGVFGCSAITAVTVQSTLGVFDCQPISPPLLEQTLLRLHEDLPFDGVKIGMLGTTRNAEIVSDFLRARNDRAAPQKGVVVLDPVLRSSSGAALFPEDSIAFLRDKLVPLVDWITPNWAELALLSGEAVTDLASAERAMRKLLDWLPGLHIVATGGDQGEPYDLLLVPDGEVTALPGTRVETTSTHGTGCAFSSALLCNVLGGVAPVRAVGQAKAYVEQALRSAPGVGRGRGPMGLLWPLQQHPAPPKRNRC